MRSYQSITYSRTDKDYYARTPVENGTMNGRIAKIGMWAGVGLVVVGVVVTVSHMGEGGSSRFLESANLAQKMPSYWSTGSSSSSSSSSSSTSSSTSSTKAAVMPSYRLQRTGYDAVKMDHDFMTYKFLQGSSDVVEPYASMELSVDGYKESSKYYAFSVCKSSDSTDCQYGRAAVSGVSNVESAAVSVSCSPFDTLSVTVSEVDADSGTVTNSATSQAMCMYVRRELRTLTTDDLAKAMDALYTVYTVSDEEGESLYGEGYHNAAYALRFHHFNAAWRESDHIHEGNGFAPQHIKMTNLIEKSMQKVDPSVALPYWDFTIDHAENHVSFNSDVFSETMFGGMTKPADLFSGFTAENDPITTGMIPNGRWAGLKADMNTMYPELKYGFGYMRAPWNMNPSPYVSRFAAELEIGVMLPSCTQHYDMLTYTKRMEFLYDIQNGPHATTHALTGGTYGCDRLQPMLDAGYITDEDSLKFICSTWVFSLKEFYRYNFITPYKDCVVGDDVDSSECGFTCTTDEEELTEFKKNMEQKLSKYVPDTMGDDGWQAWKSFICEGDGWKIFSGDHLESASPADPSFWSIHPTLERLMQAKTMAGGFEAETGDWQGDSKDGEVCDKAECYLEEKGERGRYDDCCMGHNENDATLNFVTGVKTEQWGETNRQILDNTNPTREDYAMPYIYDTFTWDHCDEDFEDVLTKVHAGIVVEVDEKQSLLGPDETPVTSTVTATTTIAQPVASVSSSTTQSFTTTTTAAQPVTSTSSTQQQQVTQPVTSGSSTSTTKTGSTGTSTTGTFKRGMPPPPNPGMSLRGV